MNAFATYLISLIRAQGPISVATFMAEALGNEKHGYYMKKDPFGQQGDFTTAPEISQIFGEMIGLWQATNWLNMDRPARVHLIELGPGRGTLMQDALRAMKIIPGLLEAARVHLVEMSPILRKMQQKKLRDFPTPEWHNRIGDILHQARGAPILVIANEFFDALPVRQFQKTDSGWHERLVCLDGQDRLAFKLAPMPAPEQIIPGVLQRADPGSIFELCSAGEHIMAEIAEHIGQFGGAALIIDYGYVRHGCGDSLQAVKNHKYANILRDPGDSDLTTHVNFHRLREIALTYNTTTYGPTGQGSFLNSLGIRERAAALGKGASARQREDIRTALHRLTHEDEMGRLFKVMAVTETGLPDIAGFEAGVSQSGDEIC